MKVDKRIINFTLNKFRIDLYQAIYAVWIKKGSSATETLAIIFTVYGN